MHYQRNVIIAAFRAAHPDKLEVTEQGLDDFDDTLFQFYDQEVRTQAAERQIPIDDFNLSMLVYFATRSTAQMVKTRVKHACVFFLSVQPAP
ncbi:MAG TPA: hypothetical protein VJ276_14650 [Thermoanaerobaculia bacterium]|nr:hypothetical protein [Thermoanaerobaculia bacterium]